MKILLGKHKGKTIYVSNDKNLKIRPTMTKIRMALFNILYSRINNSSDSSDIFFTDNVVSDLSCGYGSLGMEALSRGAKFCYFLDKNPQALLLVKKTLEKLDETANAKLINSDIEKLPIAKEACDVIFIDPPYIYQASQLTKIIEDLENKHWMKKNAILIIETRVNRNISYDIAKFDVIVDRIYGKTKILILQKNAILL